MSALIRNPQAIAAAELLNDFLLFLCYFYKKKNGREFIISRPLGRRSHHIIIAEEFVKCFYLQSNRLIINVPPGYAKTTMLTYFMAWCYAHYPDCQFIYVSYNEDRAMAATKECRDIVALREFKELFGVTINPDARAGSNWQTTAGGVCCAYGSKGGITGSNAGLLHPQDRFTGGIILDDMHKPDEAHGPVCQKVIQNYQETIAQRPRNPFVPIISVGQRVQESDYISFLLSGGDGYVWRRVVLAALDVNNNALDPSKDSVEALLIKKKVSPYVFASQFQQDPIPAGGALFPREYFTLLDYEPEIEYSFITVDTAETEKEYNDATVFSFWGLYRVEIDGKNTTKWALHWIDCVEIRVKPYMLESEFMAFWNSCYLYKCTPSAAHIEVKSTGVTLYSILKEVRGLNVREIKRHPGFSKSDRFVSIEGTIGDKAISLPRDGKHTEMCLEHMSKITANNTHRRDDIADTCRDAVEIGLLNRAIITGLEIMSNKNSVGDLVASRLRRINQAQQRSYHEINRR